MGEPMLAFFDLEISYQPSMEALWADTNDKQEIDIWKEFWPFGVSIGALKLSTEPKVILWYDTDPLGDWLDGYIMPGMPALAWSLSKAKQFVQIFWDKFS